MMLPPFIVLIGACLVTWGARSPVVNVPVLGDVLLFELSQAAAWTLCLSSALAVLLLLLKQRALSLTAVVVSIVAAVLLARELTTKITQLKSEGKVSNVETVLRDAHVRPGAVFLGGGLLIQLLGIMFRSQPAGKLR